MSFNKYNQEDLKKKTIKENEKKNLKKKKSEILNFVTTNNRINNIKK